MENITPVNYSDFIQAHVATEYSETVRLLGLVRALTCDHQLLETTFAKLAQRLDIDAMAGVNLDVIGRIVGQPRTVIDASGVAFFGFADHPQAFGFGDPNNSAVGGRFKDPNESLTGNKRLIDSEYRTFLKARVIKNHSKSIGDDVIGMFKFLLGEEVDVYVVNARPRPGHGWIGIGKQLSVSESYLLASTELVPRTTGVTYHMRDFKRPFGFNGVPGVGGFGDPLDSTVGGYFPRIIA